MISRRGFIHHPLVMGAIMFIVGLLLGWILAKGIISTPLAIRCK